MEFDPDAEFGFEILIGDEIPAYVTIEELQELLKEKAYQTKWDDFILSLKGDDNDARMSTPKGFGLFPLWVSSHLLVQTCMQDPDAYDWSKITEMYNISRIAEILYIWVNPYVWQPQTERPISDSIIMGKVATMQFDAGNAGLPAHNWLTKMLRERILYFADRKPCALYDLELKDEGKILKGMLLWNMIVTDARKYFHTFLKDDSTKSDGHIEYFKPEAFRENLQFIAEERSPQVAAEILRSLRKDWKAIVTWKCFNIDHLTPEQIEAFRACLFEGMDYYLEQWDAASSEQLDSAGKSSVFEFITDQCYKEGKVEAIEAEMRAACKGTAVAMWKTIRTNEALGYLSTKDVSASKIYKALTNHFGKLPYNERNFRDARNKH